MLVTTKSVVKLILAVSLTLTYCAPCWSDSPAGESRHFWFQQGQEKLQQALKNQPREMTAKNIILFIGDGNGVSSITATRIFDGQAKGLAGEENLLAYEQFPYTALVKTYNTNQQTPDSAGTMTAIVTGVKTKAGLISMDQSIERGVCQNPVDAQLPSRLPTILEQLASQGKATGIITTTRITHATPAATYAHTPERDWESDANIPRRYRSHCQDIAAQLVQSSHANRLQVILGGGRRSFMTQHQRDPEYPNIKGEREQTDLLARWLKQNPDGTFIWNHNQFDALSTPGSVSAKGAVLGLFEPSHMKFEADRATDNAGEPSLSEMTRFAIDKLQKQPEGYFLVVEGGRIDHAHHANNAYRALVDGQAFSEAVQTAVDRVDLNETLIVVTADHSHVLTLAGYPTRGNPILGKVISNDSNGKAETTPAQGADGLPYTTLGYHNGTEKKTSGTRIDLTHVDTTAIDYTQEFAIPTGYETHGGEDVAVYAVGPWAHLFQGVIEQNYIYHVMRYATAPEPTPQ